MIPINRIPNWGVLLDAAARGDLPNLHTRATPELVARDLAGQVVYLATPYSLMTILGGEWNYPRSCVMLDRAAGQAARLAALGVTALSPIVQSASMCHVSRSLDPLDNVFWARWCAPLLAASAAVVVPAIQGWRSSLGVWAEVTVALGDGRPVYLYQGVGDAI